MKVEGKWGMEDKMRARVKLLHKMQTMNFVQSVSS